MLLESLRAGLEALLLGFTNFTPGHIFMMLIGGGLLYLGIRRGFEPLLLVPIGFGAILTNIPLAEVMGPDGFLRTLYDAGILTELFPIFIFVGIGAMTDFEPLLANPKILLLGAAGQFGIFLTLLLALLIGFTKLEALAIGHHRSLRRSDGNLRHFDLRAAPARLRLCRSLLLHVARAPDPTSRDASADDEKRKAGDDGKQRREVGIEDG